MKTKTFIIIVLLACTFLMGCAGVGSYDHDFEPDGQKGPGLFTGAEGQLEILRR